LLDEFYASGDSKEVSLSEWVVRESLPLVDHLTPRNFALYEKLGVPMLLLFLVSLRTRLACHSFLANAHPAFFLAGPHQSARA
jgi:hypothetical protein